MPFFLYLVLEKAAFEKKATPKTRPSKQCKSLIDALILRQYLDEKGFFVQEIKMDKKKKGNKGHCCK